MNDAPAQLIMLRGPSVNQLIELTRDRIQIGRSADNDIAINDAEVSRRHALLIKGADGQYAIEDLGSTNGTFVNGKRLTGRTPLREGDMVDFGDSIRLEYQEPVFMPLGEPELEDDTADLEPLPPTPPPQRYAVTDHTATDPPYEEDDQPIWMQRRVQIGCGCALLLFLCFCSSTLLFLDWYQQGAVLYCGGLRPLFEVLLNIGPLEFNPVACPGITTG